MIYKPFSKIRPGNIMVFGGTLVRILWLRETGTGVDVYFHFRDSDPFPYVNSLNNFQYAHLSRYFTNEEGFYFIDSDGKSADFIYRIEYGVYTLICPKYDIKFNINCIHQMQNIYFNLTKEVLPIIL